VKYTFAVLVLTILGTLFIPLSLNEADASGTLFGGDKDDNVFTINVNNGLGALVGNMAAGGSTEIECTPDGITCWSQQPDGFFTATQFSSATGTSIGGPVANFGSHTGLEWVGATLFATVIFSGGGGSPSELHTLVPSTGVSTNIGLTGVGPIAGLAFDVCTSTMYGIAGGPGPANLYTINLGSGIANLVGTTSMQAGSLQFGPDGQLYAGGTGPDTGNLFRINPSNGASTLVGSTGFGPVTGLTLIGQVECGPLGGIFEGVSTSALLVAGTYFTAAWLIPVIVAGIGIAIVIARKF